METTVNEPKGITMHTETLRMCVVDLSKEEKGGVLESILHDYFPDEFHEDTDRTVRVVSNILRDNIARNNEKYTTRKAKNAEYWEKYNRERKEREANKILQELQKLQGVVIPDNALQSLTNIGLDNKSKDNKSKDNKSKSKPQPKSQPQSNPQSNEVDNTSISNNENINNSLSENKYTLPQVQEILERERIFFKQNWLREFYLLNNVTYKWKYDPISAALAFIRLHPEATKGEKKENFPPSSAAPPEGAADAAYSEMEAGAYRAACELWDAIYKEIRPKIRDEDSKFLSTNLRPDIAWRQGYTVKCLRFIVKNGDSKPTFAELVKTADGILVPHRETFTKYGVKIYYRPEKAEGTKKDVNG
ncbi:MAG: hypothetical protein J6T33_08205 [Bacteroidales bacterium]|nr:hypothetical protein [Bacteroidales bacterium]MBO7541625.1 hypothetical protein [Bacteroidales bacterium]